MTPLFSLFFNCQKYIWPKYTPENGYLQHFIKRKFDKNWYLQTNRLFFSIQGKIFWNNQTSWSQNSCYDNPKACIIKKVAICGSAQTLLLFQIINPLSTNPTKWLNILKQFLGHNRGIECVWPFCGVAA